MRDPGSTSTPGCSSSAPCGVQPGWEVVVRSTPLARPLIEAVVEQIARRGAYALLQLAFEPSAGRSRARRRSTLLREAAPLQQRIWQEADAFISIWAPENAREGADLSEERQSALSRRRCGRCACGTMAMEVPWVICGVPDACRRPGRRHDARRVRGVHLRRRPARLGRRGRAHARGSPTSSTRRTRCGSSGTGPI